MKEPKNMFAAPFSFEGRIRRMEYGLSYILYLVVYFCAKTMMEFESTISILGFVLLIPAFCWLKVQNVVMILVTLVGISSFRSIFSGLYVKTASLVRMHMVMIPKEEK